MQGTTTRRRWVGAHTRTKLAAVAGSVAVIGAAGAVSASPAQASIAGTTGYSLAAWPTYIDTNNSIRGNFGYFNWTTHALPTIGDGSILSSGIEVDWNPGTSGVRTLEAGTKIGGPFPGGTSASSTPRYYKASTSGAGVYSETDYTTGPGDAYTISIEDPDLDGCWEFIFGTTSFGCMTGRTADPYGMYAGISSSVIPGTGTYKSKASVKVMALHGAPKSGSGWPVAAGTWTTWRNTVDSRGLEPRVYPSSGSWCSSGWDTTGWILDTFTVGTSGLC